MAILDDGRALIVYQKADYDIDDDTELYYDMTEADLLTLLWPNMAQTFSPFSMNPEYLLDSPEIVPASPGTQAISISFNFDKGFNLGAVGGYTGVSVSGNLSGQKGCDEAEVAGTVSGEFRAFGKAKAQGSMSTAAKWDQENCSYVFDSGSFGGSIGVSTKVPIPQLSWKIPFIGSIITYADIQGSVGASVSWSQNAAFPSWPDGGSLSFGVGLGLSVRLKVPKAGVKLTGSGMGSIKGVKNYPGPLEIDGCLTFGAKAQFWKLDVEYTYEKCWNLVTTSQDIIVNGNGYSLPPNLTITYNPIAGTGQVYGSNTVLPDVTSDLFWDAPASMTVGPDGTVYAVWAKESGQSGQFGDSLFVTSFDGETWSPPIEIPDSEGFNGTAEIAFDSSGRPIVVWSSSDSSGIRQDSTTEEILQSFLSGDILYSIYEDGSWSTPQQDLTMPGNDTGVVLGVSADGQLLACWVNEGGAGSSTLYASSWNGNNWLTPVAITTGDGIIGELEVGTVNSETVVFFTADVNDDEEITDESILFSRYDGTWTAPELFSPTAVSATASMAATAVNSDGVVYSVWVAEGSQGDSGTGYSILAAAFDGSEWTNASVISSGLTIVDSLQIAIDADDTPVAAWTAPTLTTGEGGDVYGLDVFSSAYSNGTWSAPVADLCADRG